NTSLWTALWTTWGNAGVFMWTAVSEPVKFVLAEAAPRRSPGTSLSTACGHQMAAGRAASGAAWRVAVRRRVAVAPRRIFLAAWFLIALGLAGLVLGALGLQVGDVEIGSAPDEAVRGIEVLGRGQQVRVGPDRVPALDAARFGQAMPDGRGLPQPARP